MRAERHAEVVVIGAGVAGLACAKELARAGRRAVVLEKARGVGGRCATRRVDGQAVDHGPAFVHGASSAFLDELASVAEGTPLPGWPNRVDGSGSACQPRAFAPGERRVAWAEGLTVFPKHLAAGLEVRLGTRVIGLSRSQGGFVVEDASGTIRRPSVLILTPPVEQTVELLAALDDDARVASATHLLSSVGTVSCLTVLAGYPADVPAPAWDLAYPADSAVLQLISHDSRKRRGARCVVLVFQARSGWSRKHLDEPTSSWEAALLAEAAGILGDWVARPAWSQAHRWRHARIDPVCALTGPLLLNLTGGARLGLTGELFSPAGGVEGAWFAGRALARQLLDRD